MTVVLWPRQEVLQLIIPQLSTVGRVLNQQCVFEVICKLSKFQNEAGQISFAHWQGVARELLKWNEYCTHIFWEILVLAVYYLNPDLIKGNRREDIDIDYECVAIFLVLHMTDSQTIAQANKHFTINPATTSSFDSVWPLNPEGEVYPSSPVASPVSSPIRESRMRQANSPGSPLSPHSPRAQQSVMQQQPGSPKRSLGSIARTPRGSTHYLHSVQQKIPFLLKALCASNSQFADDSALTLEWLDSPANTNCLVSRRVVDFLGLVVCGGHSREQTIQRFSTLYPQWASECDVLDFSSNTEGLVSVRDITRWINSHLSMNDVLYPASITPVGIPTTNKDGGINGSDVDAFCKDNRSHQPLRQVQASTALSRSTPTVISGSSSTIIHAVSASVSRQSSFRRSSSRIAHENGLSSSGRIPMIVADADDAMAVDHSPSPLRPSRDEADHSDDMPSPSTSLSSTPQLGSFIMSSRPEVSLPQLFVNYCSKASLYMESPYYSAGITGCVDCTIVVGAVYGAVIINGCERVKLTVACRKLIVMNCLDCEFNIATLSTTIVLGDSRNISLGPYNTSFKSLRRLFKQAELGQLLMPLKSAQSGRMAMMMDDDESSAALDSDALANNLWSSYCDVNGCLEAVTTSQFNFVSEGCGMSGPLPATSTTIAALQSPEKFRAISIPFKPEYGAFDSTSVAIPVDFEQSVRRTVNEVEDIKTKLVKHIHQSQVDISEDEYSSDITSKLMSCSAISRRFMEWLIANDRVQEVLDLIRIDNDSKSNH